MLWDAQKLSSEGKGHIRVWVWDVEVLNLLLVELYVKHANYLDGGAVNVHNDAEFDQDVDAVVADEHLHFVRNRAWS
jgi:hypothetical protein